MSALAAPQGVPPAGRNPNGDWSTLLAPWVIPVSLMFWGFSLRATDVDHLSDYGLPPALPLSWYVALVALLAGAATALCAEHPRPLVLAAYTAAILLVLYGTIPILSNVPQYSWVYKHIGVTRYFEAHGQVDPRLDIYNHWPGFFALGAFGSRLAGMPNPTAYASWAEPVFAGLGAAFVAAAAREVVGGTRVPAAAGIVFILVNWTGQSYYAPQALGFTLSLAVLLLVLRDRTVASGPVADRVLSLVERVVRRPQQSDDGRRRTGLPSALLVVILCIDAVLVPTHQLTPYMLLLSVLGLVGLGMVRPRWIVVAMAVMTLGFLAFNFTYVQKNFGLFTSLNPFSNAQTQAVLGGAPEPGLRLSAATSRAMGFLVAFGTAIAAWRLARLGLFRRALPVVVLSLAPFAVIFGQSYGGEAALRVNLFAAPWCAVLIAWALSTIGGRRVRTLATAVVLTVMAVLFVPSFMGQTALNLLRPGEVQASEALYAYGRAGAVILPVAPGFPSRAGARYGLFPGETGDRPNLLRLPAFRHHQLGGQQVPLIVKEIKAYSSRGYVLFSTTQETYARLYGLVPRGALRDLEGAVASSPAFRVVYANEDARIYEFTGVRRNTLNEIPRPGAGSLPNGASRHTQPRGSLPPGGLIVAAGVLALGIVEHEWRRRRRRR